MWDEPQMIFMPTDPALFLGSMADACARSPYTIEELEQILFNEVLPACRFNLLSVETPHWKGFDPASQGYDPEWLKARILKKHRFGGGVGLRPMAGNRPVLSGDWVLNRDACTLSAGASAVRGAKLHIEHRDPVIRC